MNIARLTLSFLILIGSLVCIYLAAQSINERKSWRDQTANWQKQFDDAVQEGEQLRYGDLAAKNLILRTDEDASLAAQLKTVKPGLVQLKAALDDALIDRGRVWDNCRRAQTAETGETTVNIAEPNPHNIVDKMLLYVFQKADIANPDTPSGGMFLGEFRVTAVNAQSITLQYATRLTQRKLDQILNGPSDWVLYEVMPADRHSAFAGLDNAELSRLIPSSIRDEYARDGQPAKDDDPPESLRKVWVRNAEGKGEFKLDKPDLDAANAGFGQPAAATKEAKFVDSPGTGDYDLKEGKYENGKFVEGKFFDRKLRDYSVLLRSLQQQIWTAQDRLATTQGQYESFEASARGLNDPEKGPLAYADKEIAKFTQVLDLTKKEAMLTMEKADAAAKRMAELEASITQLIGENKKLATQFAAAQEAIARQIDAATR